MKVRQNVFDDRGATERRDLDEERKHCRFCRAIYNAKKLNNWHRIKRWWTDRQQQKQSASLPRSDQNPRGARWACGSGTLEMVK